MDDLFKTEPAPPLAEALRPASIEDVIGQSHLLGEGKPLRLVFNGGVTKFSIPSLVRKAYRISFRLFLHKSGP